MTAALLAEELASTLAEIGEEVVLRHRVGGTYDPATRSYTGGGFQEIALLAFLSPFRTDEVDGSNVLLGDVRGYMAAQAFSDAGIEPSAADTVAFTGGVFRVVRVERHAAGTVIYYVLHLRGL